MCFQRVRKTFDTSNIIIMDDEIFEPLIELMATDTSVSNSSYCMTCMYSAAGASGIRHDNIIYRYCDIKMCQS